MKYQTIDVRQVDTTCFIQLQMFSDPKNLAGIARYVRDGLFPWEE